MRNWDERVGPRRRQDPVHLPQQRARRALRVAAVYLLAVIPADFVMSRQMLRGVKTRAERTTAADSQPREARDNRADDWTGGRSRIRIRPGEAEGFAR